MRSCEFAIICNRRNNVANTARDQVSLSLRKRVRAAVDSDNTYVPRDGVPWWLIVRLVRRDTTHARP